MMLHKVISFKEPRILMFTGGTAANGFRMNLHRLTNKVSYVATISDNGGSTGIIQKYLGVLGGPGIGDLRSIFARLAPKNNPMIRMLQHRLHQSNNDNDLEAFREWNDIIHMRSPLWDNIPKAFRDIIKTGLITFENAILNNTDKNNKFNFNGGSIGNFFFTGMRIHFTSLSATIAIYKQVLELNAETKIIPIVDTNRALTISVQLSRGDTINGQNEISHPSKGTVVDKNKNQPLPSKVTKLQYINSDGLPFTPDLCEDVLPAIDEAESIAYSIGSFYTSIMPNLILPGVGERIAANKGSKVFILNGSSDRETTYIDKNGKTHKMTAIEILKELVKGTNRYGELNHSLLDYVTDLVYLDNGEIEVDIKLLQKLGIKLHKMNSSPDNAKHYDPDQLSNKLVQIANQ